MDSKQDQSSDRTKVKRRPRKVSGSYLRNAAIYYLQRFSSSSENLRRVLMRKVQRAAYHHDTDEAEAVQWIDEIIERFVQSGLLNDAAYAETKARALRERGNSDRLIHSKLSAKGVSSTIIDDALDDISEQDGNAETDAAVRFAKRRKLGPFGDPAKRECGDGKIRDKQLAALARAGFSYDLAMQIVDAKTIDELNGQGI